MNSLAFNESFQREQNKKLEHEARNKRRSHKNPLMY